MYLPLPIGGYPSLFTFATHVHDRHYLMNEVGDNNMLPISSTFSLAASKTGWQCCLHSVIRQLRPRRCKWTCLELSQGLRQARSLLAWLLISQPSWTGSIIQRTMDRLPIHCLLDNHFVTEIFSGNRDSCRDSAVPTGGTSNILGD